MDGLEGGAYKRQFVTVCHKVYCKLVLGMKLGKIDLGFLRIMSRKDGREEVACTKIPHSPWELVSPVPLTLCRGERVIQRSSFKK